MVYNIIERRSDGAINLHSVFCSETVARISKSQKGKRWRNKLNCGGAKENIIEWLKSVFLPSGYPQSVSDDYLEYQFWDSLQAYCSNIGGALSLHSTLIGMGVGKEDASPLAAAVTWLLKDGAGMVSAITFAYAKGHQFDNNSKQWRLFADFANDIANLLRLLAPILPFPFLVTLCVASVMSSLVGVAGAATRASLIQHQAMCNNMADVAAKDNSQETMVNLSGLITSLTLLPFFTANAITTWITFFISVCLHLYTNFRAMKSLQIETLNRPRLLYIFEHLVDGKAVPNIQLTNASEPLFYGPAFLSDYLSPCWQLKLGKSLACLKTSSDDISHQLAAQLDHEYVLLIEPKYGNIYVLFRDRKDGKDLSSCDIDDLFYSSDTDAPLKFKTNGDYFLSEKRIGGRKIESNENDFDTEEIAEEKKYVDKADLISEKLKFDPAEKLETLGEDNFVLGDKIPNLPEKNPVEIYSKIIKENLIILESFWCAYLCAINMENKENISEKFILDCEENLVEFVLKSKVKAKESFEHIPKWFTKLGWKLDPLRLSVEEWKIVHVDQYGKFSAKQL